MSINELMDTVPPRLTETVVKSLSSVKGIVSVSSVRARRSDPRVFVDATIKVPRGLPIEDAHFIVTSAGEAVKSAIEGADVVVHVEPAEEELSTKEHAAEDYQPEVGKCFPSYTDLQQGNVANGSHELPQDYEREDLAHFLDHPHPSAPGRRDQTLARDLVDRQLRNPKVIGEFLYSFPCSAHDSGEVPHEFLCANLLAYLYLLMRTTPRFDPRAELTSLTTPTIVPLASTMGSSSNSLLSMVRGALFFLAAL